MPVTASPENLAQQVRFVFRGTVKKLKAATLKEIENTDETAVVHVDETIHAPQALSHYTGQDITVQLPDPKSVKVGQKAVFFTNAWLFGNTSIAVRSVAQHAPGPQTAALKTSGADPVSTLAERDLQARYQSSDVVVSGRILSVALPAPHPRSLRPREHDPHWQEAVVEIDKVHKGVYTAKNVIVRFPSSNDRVWHEAPKLRPGQRGYFLLHKPKVALMSSGQEVYTVTRPEDFHPDGRAQAIRKVLNISGAA